MNLTNDDWYRLFICAVRHAMPRTSHTSPEMAEIISKNAKNLTPETRAVLIQDIERALSRGTVDRRDVDQWVVALEKLKGKIE